MIQYVTWTKKEMSVSLFTVNTCKQLKHSSFAGFWNAITNIHNSLHYKSRVLFLLNSKLGHHINILMDEYIALLCLLYLTNTCTLLQLLFDFKVLYYQHYPRIL